MKLLLVLATVLAVVRAQRPWYAGSGPIGYPGLANRFKDESTTTTTRPLNNRFDGTTQKIPIDALGDYELVNRVNQWPREHRPFWVLNADHIEAQRNTPPRGGNTPQNLQSRFGGQQDNNNNNNNNYPDPYYYYSFGYDDFGNPVFYHY